MSGHIEGERHVSEVADTKKINRKHGLLIIGVVSVAIIAYLVLHNGGAKPSAAASGAHVGAIQEGVPYEAPKPQPAVMQVPAPPAEPAPKPFLQSILPTVAVTDPLAKAREASLLGANEQTAANAVAPSTAAPITIPQSHPETALGAQLHPTLLTGAMATALPHPDMTVTMGTLIPCVLDTALDSTAPGMVICTTQRDVYGTTGRVVLLDRGTKIVGEYSTNVTAGQNRLFVLWDRAETPEHVVISLASPGADDLGRGGFDGQVDNHFWQKFGGAMMLTAIDGAFSIGEAALSHGGMFLNLGQGQSTAEEALQNSINIRPTIRKNQGEIVSVMVARDLDFSGIYHLQMVAK